jgi:DNA-binding NarL/FixJ family response regulator
MRRRNSGAAGLAAALFLCPKTIEHHLGSVSRKRGFKSRRELAGAFARMPGTDVRAPR